jgi:hypothetical protein
VTARKDGKFLNPALAQFLTMFLMSGKSKANEKSKTK